MPLIPMAATSRDLAAALRRAALLIELWPFVKKHKPYHPDVRLLVEYADSQSQRPRRRHPLPSPQMVLSPADFDWSGLERPLRRVRRVVSPDEWRQSQRQAQEEGSLRHVMLAELWPSDLPKETECWLPGVGLLWSAPADGSSLWLHSRPATRAVILPLRPRRGAAEQGRERTPPARVHLNSWDGQRCERANRAAPPGPTAVPSVPRGSEANSAASDTTTASEDL